MAWLAGRLEAQEHQRVLASGLLWIAGGLASEEARPWLWIAALAVDFAAPVALDRVPRLGRTRTDELPVDGGHFAERFQLFVIFGLGEQVVLSGGTAAGGGLDLLRVLALTTAFAVTAALWWLYFDEVASNSKKVIAEHDAWHATRSATSTCRSSPESSRPRSAPRSSSCTPTSTSTAGRSSC